MEIDAWGDEIEGSVGLAYVCAVETCVVPIGVPALCLDGGSCDNRQKQGE